MTYRSDNQKIEACTRFIIAARHPKVVASLRPFGFSETAREEGWTRLHSVAIVLPPELDESIPEAVRELEELTGTWFPVGECTLAAYFPEVGAALMHGLYREHSTRVVVATSNWLDRLDAAEQGAAPYGADGPRAIALLAERGLTAAKREHARSLVDRFIRVSNRADEVDAYEAAQERALAHAWAWYIEWSTIARIAIKNKNLLFALGLCARNVRRRNDGAANAPDPEPVEPVLLALSSAGAAP